VRFGYDGRPFDGWARQPSRRTIEATIADGVLQRQLGEIAPTGAIPVASRTDRGVSARGNALAIRSPLPPRALLRALNGISPEIWFTHLRPLPDDQHPRTARARWYRYFVATPSAADDRWQATLALFEGAVDTRTFGRRIPAGRAAPRVVDRVQVDRAGACLVVDIVAEGFVWGMVRKIIGATQRVVEGHLEASALTAAIAGRRRLSVPLAPPEPLVLWEVEYADAWTEGPVRPNRNQVEYWADLRWGATIGQALADHLRPPEGS